MRFICFSICSAERPFAFKCALKRLAKLAPGINARIQSFFQHLVCSADSGGMPRKDIVFQTNWLHFHSMA